MPTFSSVRDKLFRKSSSRSGKNPERGSPASSSGAGADTTTYHDAPPAYTASPTPAPAPPPASARSPAVRVQRDIADNDEYANLANFDTILLIDDSGSMSGSLWREAEAALKSIAEIVTRYDEDGVDMYFLNHKSGLSPPPVEKQKAKDGYYNVTQQHMVTNIFNSVRPSRATPTGRRLEEILMPYRRQLRIASDVTDIKPINLIVITDGEPTDNPRQAIVPTARELDQLFAPSYQIGIQFFQIGVSREATIALRELDDGLKREGIRDIVDTTPCQWADSRRERVVRLSGDAILKTVLGAVDKRIDNLELGSSSRR